jgi:hypothetical protein
MKKLLLSVAIMAASLTTFAQVGIGTTTPHASAALDLTASDKGLLLPRVTSLAAITQTPEKWINDL